MFACDVNVDQRAAALHATFVCICLSHFMTASAISSDADFELRTTKLALPLFQWDLFSAHRAFLGLSIHVKLLFINTSHHPAKTGFERRALR
jgi:hypothetical protein